MTRVVAQRPLAWSVPVGRSRAPAGRRQCAPVGSRTEQKEYWAFEVIRIASLEQRAGWAKQRARQPPKASKPSKELSRQASFSLYNYSESLIIHPVSEERKPAS